MTKKRVIKTISFSAKDEYEVELLDFALDYAEYFGRYVKRLIADHMARVKEGNGDLLVVSPVTQEVRKNQTPRKPSVQQSTVTAKVDLATVDTTPPIDSTTVIEAEGDFSDDMMNFV